MAVTPIRNMRVDDERWAAWESSANAAGVSITKLVVSTMDNAGHSRLSSSSGPVVLEPAGESVVVEGPVGDVLADSRRLPAEVKVELWDAEDVLAAPLLEVAKKARRPRAKVCPHRTAETSYCRYCGGGS